MVEITWKEVDNSRLQRRYLIPQFTTSRQPYFLSNHSKHLAIDVSEGNDLKPTESDIDAENLNVFENKEFIPRHFEFPKNEEDTLIDDMEKMNGLYSLH